MKLWISKKQKNNISQSFFILIILFFSFLSRFVFLWYPAEVVFDEVHFGKFINYYLRGEYFFDVHPPLGKQILLIGALLGKYYGQFSFEKIGEKFTDNSFIYLRAIPAFAGSLIPVAVYFFLRSINFSAFNSFFASLFLVFDNAFLVQSKFIFLDTFLILFGFLGLTFFFLSRQKNYNLPLLIISGIFFGAAISVKLTAIGFFIFVSFFILVDIIKKIFLSVKHLFFLKKIVFFFFFAFLVYFLSFCVHFKLLPKPGPGNAFMSNEFLSGEKNLFGKFVELNKAIYLSNQKLKAGHPYSSPFYFWPFLIRPIFYWTSSAGNKIYFLGNPILWWTSTFFIFISLFFLIWQRKLSNNPLFLILVAYFSFLFPFIGIKRVTFLYHYLPALPLAISLIPFFLSKTRTLRNFLYIFLILVIISFLYFSPLSYGFLISPKEFQQRMWLKAWL